MYFGWLGLIVVGLEMVFTFSIIDAFGFFQSFLLWAAGAALGVFLISRQGFSSLIKAQKGLDQGVLPVAAIFEGLCFFIAGALLIFPGFLSDFVAILLLIPPLRGFLRQKGGSIFNLKEPPLRDGEIIEGAYVRVEEKTEIIDYTPPQN